MQNAPQQPQPASSTSGRVARCVGQVVYIFAYDIAYDMVGEPQTLLGQELVQFATGPSKRAPRDVLFYRPKMIHLPPLPMAGPHGSATIERTVKLFPLGAISISVRVPFDVASMDDLIDYHELQLAGEFSPGLDTANADAAGHRGPKSLHDHVQRLAEDIRRDLQPYCVPPLSQLKEEEAYTVFCVNAPLTDEAGSPLSAEDWLEDHRRQVAALLTQEPQADKLSDQEAIESTGKHLSYYESDVAVLDWDAALLVDQPENFDESLHIIELANVQLAELEAYDRTLDDSLTNSYRDLESRSFRRRGFAGKKLRKVLSRLRDIRIDLARLSDELFNTTKFFGDWHMARIYQNISSRFHLGDWQRMVEDKLRTLDSLYQIVQRDQMNYWMLLLEVTVVLLFVIDLVLLFVPLLPK